MKHSPANDNVAPDKVERQIAGTLSATALTEHQLKIELPKVLEANGASVDLRAAVAEFMKPIVSIMHEWERESIDFARDSRSSVVTGDLIDGMLTTLEAFGDEFERTAKTPEQRRAAVSFQRFVGDMAAVLSPERPPLAIEIEEPDLGVREAHDAPRPANGNERRRGR